MRDSIKQIMLSILLKFIVNTPVYPHWLEHLKMKQGNEKILKGLKGSVLEVGAGDGTRKIVLMNHYPKIKSYIATDYSSWDKEFASFSKISNKYGRLGEILMGRQTRLKLDNVCSATKLPYKNNFFDYHLSFEVLEHLDDPFSYFTEATRVVKPSGKIIFSVPFLYREHKMDYLRYTTGFFNKVAKDNNLKIISIYCNAGVGTTSATLFNQWLVRLIMESSIFLKFILLLISPIFFFINNVIGWVVDLKPDKRFTTRYHVVLKKLA